MIILKSPSEIATLRAANRIVVEVMAEVVAAIEPGVTTLALDHLAEAAIRTRGGEPSFKGYLGYQHTLCTSVNEVVVHGVPNNIPLRRGDIISVDCGVRYEGFHGDHAWTFVVGGEPTPQVAALLRVTEEALYRGIEQMQPGHRVFDISAAIQQHVERHGFSVVRDYVGHGVGRSLHEEPQVPNYGTAGTGPKLVPGMVLALEPMVNEGTAKVRLLEDGWTVVTADRKLSAHFEHSVVVTEHGPEILSRMS